MRTRVRPLRAMLSGVLGVALLSGLVTIAIPAQAADQPLIIWADPIRAAVLKQQFPNGYQGSPLEIVTKDSLSVLKAEFLTSTAENGPDIIVSEHDSTGELVQARMVRQLKVSAATRKLFPVNVLAGFEYDQRVYGIPFQFENVAMITNASLVKTQPKTFTKMAKQALALKGSGQVDVGIAVGQAPSGNAYDTYPLFSGLGGYFFGKDAVGNFDPSDLGVANPTFLANAGKIDGWNRSGLVNSSYSRETAKAAFVAGKAPFWITGPWDLATLKALSFPFRISSVPEITKGVAAAPFLGIKGFMVTIHAKAHGVRPKAVDFVTKGVTQKKVQLAFATASLRVPATIEAADANPDRRVLAFGLAGASGVALPNIPQTRSVWAPLGSAWSSSTRGADAVPAATAFPEAQVLIATAIGG